MSSESPASVLYSSDGIELAVISGNSIPVGTRALLVSGQNPSGDAMYVPTAAEGALGITNMSNDFVVLSNATVTTSGSQLVTSNWFGTQEIALIVNVTATPTGTTPTLTFTIQEVDPGNATTVYGNSATTTTITGSNTPGVFTAVLNITTSSMVRVSWTIGGTTPSFTGVYATITTKVTPSTQTVNGTVSITGTVTITGTITANQGAPNTLANAWPVELTDGYGNLFGEPNNPIWVTGAITANNSSVGPDGGPALADDTQVGGVTSTNAPTYTNGNLDALSLTTKGGLRIDGVYPTTTTTANAPDMMVTGGYVTTSSPTYTTGQIDALSLTTAGALRVDGSAVTQPVSGTVTANQGLPNTLANAWPVELTDGYGNLFGEPNNPISVVTNKAQTSNITSVTATTSSQTLLNANSRRLFASVYNGGTRNAYIVLSSSAASATNYSIVLMTGSYWEVPVDWAGQVNIIWATTGAAALTGSAYVTELTP